MTRTGWLAAGVLAAAGLGWACASTPTSTNNCGTGSPPSLVGNYTLKQYTWGSTVYAPPSASGSLAFTATTYAQTVTLPVSASRDTVLSDNGTYLLVGSECISEFSAVPGNRDFGGTFKVATVQGQTTLTLDGNDSLKVIVGVWTKQ